MQRALEQGDFVTGADIKYINASGTIVSISLSVVGGVGEAWPSRRGSVPTRPSRALPMNLRIMRLPRLEIQVGLQTTLLLGFKELT